MSSENRVAGNRPLWPLVLLLAALFCAPARVGVAAEPLVLERTIALKGVSGRIDHLAIDLVRKRLFVAELGNGTLDVIDLAVGQVVRRIDGLKEPQGVGYVPGADVVAIANAGDGSVRLFRGEALLPTGRVELGDDADNIRLDVRSGMLVVGYGSGGLAVIDPADGRLVRRIPLPAHPEGFQLDATGHRAFVNVPDARQIAIVDMNEGRQTASWRAPDLRANFPMAFDGGLVAVVFRNPPRLMLFDANSGGRVGSFTSCSDADDVFFDDKRRRIYASCGDGKVDVWQEEVGVYHPLSTVRTATGARTSLFVPELDRLFVAARAGFFGLGSAAAILVLRPAD